MSGVVDHIIGEGHEGTEHLRKIMIGVDDIITYRILVRPQDFHAFNGVPHDASLDLLEVLETELNMSTHDADWSRETAGYIVTALENACTAMYTCRIGIATLNYANEEDCFKLQAFLHSFIMLSLGDHNHGKLLDKFDYANDELQE